MKGLGGLLLVLGVLFYLFTGQIPGFEGKNEIVGIALGFIGVVLLGLGLYQERPSNKTIVRQSVTDDGTGRPVMHEDTVKEKNGL